MSLYREIVCRRQYACAVLLSLLFIGMSMPAHSQMGKVTECTLGSTTIRTGAMMLFSRGHNLVGTNVAVVCNHTSLVDGVHLVDTLLRCGVRVVKLFCPEHGFRGTAAAGARVDDGMDSQTGLPVISLYGRNKKPTAAQLADVDCVVFDLQDVGCRFYTYLSTLHYVMQACAECGKPIVVLDRPNPNGHYVDGPVLDTARCRSFVGMHPVPVVYGMTIGEYALMVNGEGWLGSDHWGDTLRCPLTVVPLEGYSHDSLCCRQVTLPVPPSPNLRTPQAIALYPSLCLLEGTTVSLGRGTPFPFEVIGNQPDTMDLRQVDVASRFELKYLAAFLRRTPQGNFFLANNFFEKLAGTTELRHQLTSGMDESAIRATWQPALQHFKEVRQRYLLYPDGVR